MNRHQILTKLRTGKILTDKAERYATVDRLALFRAGVDAGLTSRELAEAAGVQPSTVRVALSRAR